ncbi:MAG: 4-hydroxy-tetrahydrodipicolinate reductase [Acidobacteriota bacterium]
MKIALIGYGAMGHLVAKLAGEQGHEIAATIDIDAAAKSVEELKAALEDCDVAIDFSIADAVLKNAEACARAGVPLVVGTTGWHAALDQVKNVVSEHDGALIYGANFSIGVQLFYRIAAAAADLFRSLDSYDAFIEEAHHKRKRDAPSGTALQLGEIVAQHFARDVPISSTRGGYIPGTHRLSFDSKADHIMVEHVARSREGFAAGALMAAEWIVGREGVFEFSEVFGEILATEAQRH